MAEPLINDLDRDMASGGGGMYNKERHPSVASILEEYGAVDESTALYERTAALAPESASYALNYVHVLELSGRYREGKALANYAQF